ncbi:MAG: response regulator [Flavobacterium sp.]|nr:MAG: response regulator [Flavobacterium sp.]
MKPYSILLVDDDADDQLFFIEALNTIDHSLECDVACNGVEAIGYLSRLKKLPAVIFLDLNMPMMNGYECLEAIRRQEVFSEIPIIVLTTSSNRVEAERTKKLGADTFITKTADLRMFRHQLNEILMGI